MLRREVAKMNLELKIFHLLKIEQSKLYCEHRQTLVLLTRSHRGAGQSTGIRGVRR